MKTIAIISQKGGAGKTTRDVAWLVKKKIPVEVASSPLRIYKDSQYRRPGAKIVPIFQKANLLVGIKEPPPDTLIPNLNKPEPNRS